MTPDLISHGFPKQFSLLRFMLIWTSATHFLLSSKLEKRYIAFVDLPFCLCVWKIRDPCRSKEHISMDLVLEAFKPFPQVSVESWVFCGIISYCSLPYSLWPHWLFCYPLKSTQVSQGLSTSVCLKPSSPGFLNGLLISSLGLLFKCHLNTEIFSDFLIYKIGAPLSSCSLCLFPSFFFPSKCFLWPEKIVCVFLCAGLECKFQWE